MNYQFYKKLPLEAKKIRQEVFVKEQGFKNEFDDIDKNCIHLVVFQEEKAIGCARMICENDSVILGRIAVLKEYRQLHVGSYILQCLENKAKELNYTKIELSAQVRASQFYLKNGYQIYGDEYLDEYCPHVHMEKTYKSNE